MPERQFVGFEVASSDDVSPCWRVLPLLAYLLVILACLAGAVAVGTTVSRFHDQCPLYARPVVAEFDGQNVTLNERASDAERTSWGEAHICNMAEFMPIFTVIFSAAFFFFFCMCGKGGKGSAEGFGMDSPWRIVCPGLVFNMIITMAALVCSVWTSSGVHLFCLGLEESNSDISCLNLNNYHFVEYPKISNLRSWFILAQVSSWVMFSGLLFVTLLLSLRCLCRPDLTPLYETMTGVTDDRRPSTDTFVTAESTPRRAAGPGGDAAAAPVLVEAVSPIIHHSADQ